jgi:hypothetical protein
VRRVFTADESGLTRPALRWGVRAGKWQHLEREVYLDGPEPPDEFDRARARVLAAKTVARGTLAGVLHGLDSVTLDGWPTRRSSPPSMRIQTLSNVPCADGLTTLIDIAAVLNHRTWGRTLTWYEVVQIPRATARRLAALVEQVKQRPLAQTA